MNIIVIGGGISGISAAKVALGFGHKVTILEVSDELGGLMAKIANCRVGFKTFFDEIKKNPNLKVIKRSKIKGIEKENGFFVIELVHGEKLKAEKIIIATGLVPYEPTKYKGKRVVTSLEYDAIIDQRNEKLPHDFNRIAFILCVGSRSKEYPLCSSVCCSYTLRQIKWTLQRTRPSITVLYNDLRFFGLEFFMERVFREEGVRFLRTNSRYFEEHEEGVTVRYFCGGKLREERFDYVVLAIGLRPNPVLPELGRLFGFSLNDFGFVKENGALRTDAYGIYACGGALEPMNIKDSILTGFGAGFLASVEEDKGNNGLYTKIYREDEPEIPVFQEKHNSYLFYLGTERPELRIFYEYISHKFIEAARKLVSLGKTVYFVTKNLVTPSYGELIYEMARREGVLFIHLEEEESLHVSQNRASIEGGFRKIDINFDRIVQFEDYAKDLINKEFLSFYRSEPQLRWSPTKWGRGRYHVGFIRHPREKRWEEREMLGALGEIFMDEREERILPKLDEERCSGCGSCKGACPHGAIELETMEKHISVFGPTTSSAKHVAKIKSEICAGCGVCASICPSDVIFLPAPLAAS